MSAELALRVSQIRGDQELLATVLGGMIEGVVAVDAEERVLFAESGRVTIRWRRNGSTGVIDVEDTGIGIAPRDQVRVFERFCRVDKARSRELGGTGLGLSIVKHLVQAFGGKVSVTSEVGRGSVFTVRLPAA